MSALPVAMTLSGVSVTIPANVLFATATISAHDSYITNFTINGSKFYFGSQTRVDAGAAYFTSPLQGIGLKGGDILTCGSGFSVNMIAYTS